MALGTFLAGRFSATYDPPGSTSAADVGITEEGWELSWQLAVQAINNSDAYGDMFIDGILRGLSQVFLQCDSLEAKAGSYLAVSPLLELAPAGATVLGPGVIGRLMSATAGITILTATAAAPAAAAPATLTATFSHLAENFDAKLLLHSKLRKVPIRLRCLAYLDTTIKFVTMT